MKQIFYIFNVIIYFLCQNLCAPVYGQSIWKAVDLSAVDYADYENIYEAKQSVNVLLKEYSKILPQLKAGDNYCVDTHERNYFERKEYGKTTEDCDQALLVDKLHSKLYLGPMCCKLDVDVFRTKKVKCLPYSCSSEKSYVATLLWRDGSYFYGTISYINSMELQKGVKVYDQDKYYIGEFKKEVPHGVGKMFDGEIVKNGLWFNGNYEGEERSRASNVIYSRISEVPNTKEPSEDLQKVEDMIRRYTKKTDGIKALLLDNSLRPSVNDFRNLLKSNHIGYVVTQHNKYSDYFNSIRISDISFDDFSSDTYDISLISINDFSNNWRNGGVKQRFANPKDTFVKVTFYNKSERPITSYDLYFYKIPNTDRYKIIQLQFFRLNIN